MERNQRNQRQRQRHITKRSRIPNPHSYTRSIQQQNRNLDYRIHGKRNKSDTHNSIRRKNQQNRHNQCRKRKLYRERMELFKQQRLRNNRNC